MSFKLVCHVPPRLCKTYKHPYLYGVEMLLVNFKILFVNFIWAAFVIKFLIATQVCKKVWYTLYKYYHNYDKRRINQKQF